MVHLIHSRKYYLSSYLPCSERLAFSMLFTCYQTLFELFLTSLRQLFAYVQQGLQLATSIRYQSELDATANPKLLVRFSFQWTRPI